MKLGVFVIFFYPLSLFVTAPLTIRGAKVQDGALIQPIQAPLVARGAGVLWTPLRHSAEAPTEPTGETTGGFADA